MLAFSKEPACPNFNKPKNLVLSVKFRIFVTLELNINERRKYKQI